MVTATGAAMADPRWHLEPNLSPADWEFRAKINSFSPDIGGDTTAGLVAESLSRTFYHEPIFFQSVRCEVDYTGAAQTWARLIAPAWSIDENVLIASSIDLVESRVRLVQAVMTLVDCDAYAISFDALIWLIDGVEYLIGGSSVLPASGGPYGFAGTGYDGRLNITIQDALPESSPVSFSGIGCGMDPPVSKRRGLFTAFGGWRFDDGGGYQSVPIAIDPLGAHPLSCPCPQALPAITGSNSWEVSNQAGVDDLYNTETITVICPTDLIPPGPPVVFDIVYHPDREFLHLLSQVGIQASHAPHLRSTRRTRQAACNKGGIFGPPSESMSIVHEGITYCTQQRQAIRYEEDQHCTSDGRFTGPVYCRPRAQCVYKAFSVLDWPVLPDCETPEVGPPHNTRDLLGRLTRVATRDDRLWLLRANAGSPRSGWHHELTWGQAVTQPRGLWNLQNIYELLYRSAVDGHVYWTRSTDACNTFETPELLFMAAKHPHPFHDSRGYVGYAVFRNDSGDTGPGKIYLRVQKPSQNDPDAEFPVADSVGTPIAFADSAFGLTCPDVAPAPWILSAIKAGDTEPSEFESTDCGDSWEEVS